MSDSTYPDVATLKQEVSALEHQNVAAIDNLETELTGLLEGLSVIEDDWSPRLDTIDVITMEEIPSLKESIRKITTKKG